MNSALAEDTDVGHMGPQCTRPRPKSTDEMGACQGDAGGSKELEADSMGLESMSLDHGTAKPRYPSGPSGSSARSRTTDADSTCGENCTTGTFGDGLRHDDQVTIDEHRVLRNRAWVSNGGRLATKAVSPKYSAEEMTR